ncbi:MAG: hypothetical protein HQK93_10155, partial [Nitrospirae bacterium]|nr:hypothetical protein [Nitrospirota bacterium]
MSKEPLINAINDISLNLIEMDLENPDDLSSLLTSFKEISAKSESCGESVALKAASKAVIIIQKIINKESQLDKQGAFETLSLTITALQELIINFRPVEDIAFPDELGMDDEESIAVTNEETANALDSTQIPEVIEIAAEPAADQPIDLDNAGFEKLQNSINELSSMILLANAEKMEDVVVILNSFEAIKNEASELGQEKISNKAQTASEIAKQILFDDIHDKKAVIDTLYQTVKYMSGILNGDTEIEEPSLTIDSAPPAAIEESAQILAQHDAAYPQRIIEIITDLASKIKEADFESLQDIANIHSIYEELFLMAKEEGQDFIHQEAVKCAEIARKMVMDEVEDKKTSFEIISTASLSLNEIVTGGGVATEEKPVQTEEPAADETPIQKNLPILIEELVKALSTAEVDSLQDIANLHSAYEVITEMTAVNGPEIVHQAAVKCTEIAKKMVMDEVENKSASFNTLYMA